VKRDPLECPNQLQGAESLRARHVTGFTSPGVASVPGFSPAGRPTRLPRRAFGTLPTTFGRPAGLLKPGRPSTAAARAPDDSDTRRAEQLIELAHLKAFPAKRKQRSICCTSGRPRRRVSRVVFQGSGGPTAPPHLPRPPQVLGAGSLVTEPRARWGFLHRW